MKRVASLFVVVLFIAITGCRDRLKVDDAIDAKMRHEVDSLNKVVLRALSEGRSEPILKMSMEEVRKSDSNRVQLRRLLKVIRGMPLSDFRTEHQLFSNKFRPDTTSRMVFREASEHEYVFRFYQPGRATVATFGRIVVGPRELGFATTFSRIDGHWQLVTLDVGLMRMQGMNAIDWYYKAEQQLSANDLIDAYLQHSIAMAALRPAGWNIRYKMEPAIMGQKAELERQIAVNYNFPISTDPESNGAPRILSVGINCDSICLPQFTVMTNTPIADVKKITVECDSICRKLDQWFPGVSNRNKSVYFHVINKAPEETEESGEYLSLLRPTVADWRY